MMSLLAFGMCLLAPTTSRHLSRSQVALAPFEPQKIICPTFGDSWKEYLQILYPAGPGPRPSRTRPEDLDYLWLFPSNFASNALWRMRYNHAERTARRFDRNQSVQIPVQQGAIFFSSFWLIGPDEGHLSWKYQFDPDVCGTNLGRNTKDNTWVEVSAVLAGGPGIWMNVASGTGIFYNVSRVLSAKNKVEALSKLGMSVADIAEKWGEDFAWNGWGASPKRAGESCRYGDEKDFIAEKFGLHTLVQVLSVVASNPECNFALELIADCPCLDRDIYDLAKSQGYDTVHLYANTYQGGFWVSEVMNTGADNETPQAMAALIRTGRITTSAGKCDVPAAMDEGSLAVLRCSNLHVDAMLKWPPLPSALASCPETPTKLDTHIHSQPSRRVIMSALIVMLVLPLLASQLGVLGQSTLVHSLLGMFYFGMDHFLISYSNEVKNHPETWVDPSVHMMLMFVLSGLCGLVLTRTSLYNHQVVCEEVWGVVWLVASGVAVVCAQLASQRTFRTNIVNAGPFHALVETSVVLVTLFFLYYNNERPNRCQLCSIVIIFCASCMIASNAQEGANDNFNFNECISWCIATLISYTAVVICLRVGIMKKAPTGTSGLVIRMCTVGFLGACMALLILGKRWKEGDSLWLIPHWSSMFLPLLNTCAEIAGLYCMQQSFEGPEVVTGVNTAIFGSNATIVLALNYFVLGYMPDWKEITGMAMIVVAVAITTISDMSSKLFSTSIGG